MKRYLILILLTLSLGSIQAQDIFFSQFYAAHLSINPALTGFTLGDMQFSTIYRNRTQYLIPSYTYGASLDLKISRDMIKPDMFAAGAMVVLDNVKSGAISSLNAMASGAYHKAIGYDDNHYVAFGAQVEFFSVQPIPILFLMMNNGIRTRRPITQGFLLLRIFQRSNPRILI